jgi:hypothetical protein
MRRRAQPQGSRRHRSGAPEHGSRASAPRAQGEHTARKPPAAMPCRRPHPLGFGSVADERCEPAARNGRRALTARRKMPRGGTNSSTSRTDSSPSVFSPYIRAYSAASLSSTGGAAGSSGRAMRSWVTTHLTPAGPIRFAPAKVRARLVTFPCARGASRAPPTLRAGARHDKRERSPTALLLDECGTVEDVREPSVTLLLPRESARGSRPRDDLVARRTEAAQRPARFSAPWASEGRADDVHQASTTAHTPGNSGHTPTPATRSICRENVALA